MDIASFEQRATVAENLCKQLAEKVNILENTLLNTNRTSNTQTNENTVSLDEYKKALKEIESLQKENDRNKYRIAHLIKSLENEEKLVQSLKNKN